MNMVTAFRRMRIFLHARLKTARKIKTILIYGTKQTHTVKTSTQSTQVTGQEKSERGGAEGKIDVKRFKNYVLVVLR